MRFKFKTASEKKSLRKAKAKAAYIKWLDLPKPKANPRRTSGSILFNSLELLRLSRNIVRDA